MYSAGIRIAGQKHIIAGKTEGTETGVFAASPQLGGYPVFLQIEDPD